LQVKHDGEGQNRTGDTTIFSRGSGCEARASAGLRGEDFPANGFNEHLRRVSRFAGRVRGRVGEVLAWVGARVPIVRRDSLTLGSRP
jgi:hypothetical protein